MNDNDKLGFYFPFNKDFSIICYSYPMNSPVDKMKYMDFVGNMTTIHSVISTLNDVCKKFFYFKNNRMTGFELDCNHDDENDVDFNLTDEYEKNKFVIDLCKLKFTMNKNRITVVSDKIYNLQYREREIIRRCDLLCYIERYYENNKEKYTYGGIFREFNSKNNDQSRIIRNDEIMDFEFDHTTTTILDLMIKYIRDTYVTYEFLNWNWDGEININQ